MRLTRHSSLRYDKAVVRKLISLVCLAASGCGYHLANSQLNEGAGSTIAVPTFINKTTTYRIEQRLAEEDRRELIRRTRFKVVSDNAGDLLMSGEVLGYNAVPVIFTSQGGGPPNPLPVDRAAKFTEPRPAKAWFQNNRGPFREESDLSQTPTESW